jgi:hypothetical protein
VDDLAANDYLRCAPVDALPGVVETGLGASSRAEASRDSGGSDESACVRSNVACPEGDLAWISKVVEVSCDPRCAQRTSKHGTLDLCQRG